MGSGMWFVTVPSEWSLITLRPTIYGGHVQSCVTSTEASWRRSNSFSAMPQF